MGLTIHYRLHSQAADREQVRHDLARLRSRALDLPFAKVGEIVECTGPQCDYQRRERDDPHWWLLIQSAQYVEVAMGDGSVHGYRVNPTHVIAFSTWPGEGCEEANFGLCRYPKTLEIEDPDRPYRTRRVFTRLGDGWRWASFCKTQYASDPDCGGVANFLRCHLAVIRLLDQARELGLLDRVTDEGDYWEERDVAALACRVGQWNAMVAGEISKFTALLGSQTAAVMAALVESAAVVSSQPATDCS